jgi:hypothetical protein
MPIVGRHLAESADWHKGAFLQDVAYRSGHDLQGQKPNFLLPNWRNIVHMRRRLAWSRATIFIGFSRLIV